MKLKAMLHTQLWRVLMVAYLALQVVGAGAVAVAAPKQTLPAGCNYTCGDFEVPYPFGIGSSPIPDQGSCYLERRFRLTCNDSKLYKGNVPVLRIDILQGQMDVSLEVSRSCDDEDYNPSKLTSKYFSISRKENKFVTVGCDSYGYLKSVYNPSSYSTGCLTRCYGPTAGMIDDGTCSGIGCCQVDIPPRMRNISIEAYNFNSSNNPLGGCTYSFVVKKDNYYFFPIHLEQGLPSNQLPMVVDWTVGEQNCSVASHRVDYACRKNSHCNDTDIDLGYRCICNPGYDGNPYHPDGCTDINECETGNHTCITKGNCLNTVGSHKCFCPKGQFGNGTKEGGCHQRDIRTTSKVVIGVGIGVIALFVGTSSLYLIYQKRKLMELKEKFFKQNGGYILLQRLSRRKDSSQIAQIFTEEELNKATDNFDESFIIGKGGFGTVFKGFLANKRIVAIKKSKIIDASQNEQFINEVIVLSQINHKNVVKLLGCCLETEVPLLVYEFVSNGTLYDFLHKEGKENNATWKTRLKIAAEVAGALSYLHSSVSIPIIHSDVKSANILLDDTYTAKVSDFGASRLVPLDQIEIATVVQGTLGYLDPEYMQTHQLTEKSDVYSFGVVLVELLAGEKPVSFDRTEEKRSLPMHFLSCLKGDRVSEVIQDGILDEENEQQIKKVAILVAKCLRLKGEKRPSMKEVAMELEGILGSMEKTCWINSDINVEETRYLLQETSSFSIYETGDSSGHGNTGYDSLKDGVQLIVLDDGR